MRNFVYTTLKSARKTICVEIKPDGEVVVRAPYAASVAAVERFIDEKTRWIERHLEKSRPHEEIKKLTDSEIKSLSEQFYNKCAPRTEAYARQLGVSYGKISVRAQKTLWGSCSRRGNLSFNCLLAFVPEYVSDYVIVHELCHRKHMNHSAAFWREVEKILPDYKLRRDYLKKEGRRLFAAL